MSSEMIERVARAIDPHAFEPMSCHVTSTTRTVAIESARDKARRAIAATFAVESGRAPTTNAMTRAFDAAYAEASKQHGHLESSNAAFIAMMRAALESP